MCDDEKKGGAHNGSWQFRHRLALINAIKRKRERERKRKDVLFLKSNFRLRPPLSSIDSRLNYSRESLLTQESGSGTEKRALELLCRITACRLVLFARIIELRPMRLYDPLSLFVSLLPGHNRSRWHFSRLTARVSSVCPLCGVLMRCAFANSGRIAGRKMNKSKVEVTIYKSCQSGIWRNLFAHDIKFAKLRIINVVL